MDINSPTRPTAQRTIARAGSQQPLQRPSPHLQYIPLTDSFFEQEVVVDDDLTLIAYGRKYSNLRAWVFTFLCFFTCGIFYLLSRWYCSLEMNVKTYPCILADADWICVKNQWGEVSIQKVSTVAYGQKNSATFPRTFNNLALPDEPIELLKYFEYRYFRFLLNPLTGRFEPNYAWTDPQWTSVVSCLRHRDSNDEIKQKYSIFGKNQVEIAEKSNVQLLIDEVLHPFFVFQIASIILWSLDNYYYYAACIFIISVSTTISNFIEIKTNIRRMRSLSRFVCQVRLFRDGYWTNHSSDDLIPGDIFEIEPGSLNIFPCDAVLLTGDCIVNESMLTGESLPVSKVPIPDSELSSLDFDAEEPASSAHMSRYFLFSGTKIIRIRPGPPTEVEHHVRNSMNGRRGALALVVRTGFNTTKGSLVRSMLFPRPNTFKFYRDSFRFIGVLAMISFIGFLASLYNFIKLEIEWQVIIIRALDLITIAVPPALPATMAIGTSFAISRLRKSNIFCTSPPRVNIGGKINMMCFDKTGTLTEEGLDVLGVRFTLSIENEMDCPFTEVPRAQLRFSRLYRTIETLLPKPLVINQRHSPLPLANTSMPSIGNGPISLGISGASIFHAKEPGNPNLEVDYPYPLIICAMATCHSIKVVSGELVGDPLDLKMFEFTKWNIEEDFSSTISKKSGRLHATLTVRPPWVPAFDTVAKGSGFHDEVYTELGVVKSFEFASHLRRMSVVVQRIKYSNSIHSQTIPEEPLQAPDKVVDFEVFVKGAPEVMRGICTSESLPKDYDEQLKGYTHHGYRVLAVAWKKMEEHHLSTILKMKRPDIENDLIFLGFVIFENKLKPGTLPVIRTLNNACIRQVMCTGDNILTSVSVSRECELISSDTKVFVPKFVSGQSHEEDAQIVWEDVDESGATVDSVTFLPNDPLSNGDSNSERTNLIGRDYILAITGDAFQWMLEFASDESFEKMLVKCQIFARMSPDQKHFLVENLQSIGYCVGFCGDGTNDCGALKSADIGLSLSEAEASVAAPFTSKNKDLDCVLQVIREGRAALVTSFCCFKYMALYSLIQFTSVSLLYSLAQNIGDFQFMYIDLCLIIPVAVFMGQTEPYSSIYRKRPTATLVSKKVLTSLVGQILLAIAFQFYAFMWVRQQPWYDPGHTDMENEEYETMENTVVFLVSSFQYIINAIVFTVGPPYQATIWKNVPLITILIALFSVTTVLTLNPPEFMSEILDLVEIPYEGRVYILSLAIFNFIASWATEKFISPLIAKFMSFISERIDMMYINPQTDFVDPTFSLKRMAKIRKWELANKRFKIIQDGFR
ncbi:hypothetical protein HDV02_002869 [Globomyces sp. JEL0801]|nr:hypothetical protein HDV02_002869 [Globomyces sp. JEL0801]